MSLSCRFFSVVSHGGVANQTVFAVRQNVHRFAEHSRRLGGRIQGHRFRLLGSQQAHVAFAPGESDAVEVFADRDGVFPGGAEELAELRHRQSAAARKAITHAAAEVTLGVGVEIEVGGDLDGSLFLA